MPKARLSPAERQERRRESCAIYNAKNAKTLRVKARERMRKLRASRKEPKEGIKVVDKRKDLDIVKCIPHIQTVQNKVGKLTKAVKKVEDDQLSYDADSEASEEEGRRTLTTTPLKMKNNDGARARRGAQAGSWHLSRGHRRVRRKASLVPNKSQQSRCPACLSRYSQR